jgi:hypothetical protein
LIREGAGGQSYFGAVPRVSKAGKEVAQTIIPPTCQEIFGEDKIHCFDMESKIYAKYRTRCKEYCGPASIKECFPTTTQGGFYILRNYFLEHHNIPFLELTRVALARGRMFSSYSPVDSHFLEVVGPPLQDVGVTVTFDELNGKICFELNLLHPYVRLAKLLRETPAIMSSTHYYERTPAEAKSLESKLIAIEKLVSLTPQSPQLEMLMEKFLRDKAFAVILSPRHDFTREGFTRLSDSILKELVDYTSFRR